MTRRTAFIVRMIFMGAWLGAIASTITAQQETSVIADKGGKFHIGSSVLVGNSLLKPGMYKVQHVVEENNHMLVFRIIRMNPYGRAMGIERLGEEVARVKCTTEPAGKKWKHTKLLLIHNASGQKAVEAVQISGENVLHRI